MDCTATLVRLSNIFKPNVVLIDSSHCTDSKDTSHQYPTRKRLKIIKCPSPIGAQQKGVLRESTFSTHFEVTFNHDIFIVLYHTMDYLVVQVPSLGSS